MFYEVAVEVDGEEATIEVSSDTEEEAKEQISNWMRDQRLNFKVLSAKLAEEIN